MTIDISVFSVFDQYKSNVKLKEKMFSKILVIAVLCVASTLAEAPVNRYRYQRFRQAPPRQFFARQEAPYPAANEQGGDPATVYGPPSTTTPAPAYGPPPSVYGLPSSNGDTEITNNETTDNPDSEVVGQPSRLTAFNQKLSAPTKKAQKFSQRLELQQQVQQFPGQQTITPVQPLVAPVQPVAVAQVQPFAATQFAAPLTAIQQDGSYFIQLPNGSIQRVNYLTQPSLVDNSLLAQLQFRPVAEVQATVADPQLYVNTVVQSHVSTEDGRK